MSKRPESDAGLSAEPSTKLAGIGTPRCFQANSVAIRPRGVLAKNPIRTRYGSATLSIVSPSSPIAIDKVVRPTGPPLNLSTRTFRIAVSIRSKPMASTSYIASAAFTESSEIELWLFTSAKSLTRRSNRFATRGVPRERLPISETDFSSIEILRRDALRFTMRAKSSSS